MYFLSFPRFWTLSIEPHRVGFLRLFGLKTGIDFAPFGLESGVVFKGTTGVYERIFRFNSQNSSLVLFSLANLSAKPHKEKEKIEKNKKDSGLSSKKTSSRKWPFIKYYLEKAKYFE